MPGTSISDQIFPKIDATSRQDPGAERRVSLYPVKQLETVLSDAIFTDNNSVSKQ